MGPSLRSGDPSATADGSDKIPSGGSVMFRSRIAVILFLCSFVAVAQEKRNITQTDIYAFQWIAGAQISPDGSQVIYTHVKVTPKHDTYDTSLWMIPAAGGAARQLTSNPFDADPHWSPDGKQIAFVRTVAPARQQIYLLSMDGGEARQLTDMRSEEH